MNCAVFIATSIDGYIARQDGSLDWLKQVERKGEDYGFAKFFKTVDALVMGRGTWDVVRTFGSWPYGNKKVVVLTTRPPKKRLADEEFYEGKPRALVNRLTKQGVKRVYVDGGKVISQFMNAGLIDELTISRIPIILGSGIPLFSDVRVEQRFKLVRSRAWDSGLVQTTWKK